MGVVGVVRPFRVGDLVEAQHEGEAVAFGLAACASDGLSGTVLHRDDLVLAGA